MKTTILCLSILFALALPTPARSECTVCHSKKPEMRRMHESLGYKDCFSCHGPSAKPMDKARRSEDLRCIACHKS